ncbi:hypothetical protein BJ508DRAFT_417507 [Ascobolus immersus RN42]|uniref:Uncharacterized protein n=1 Tax=Ascobolus immersus RN42 TaxID=1160509 RepID=A0A3N4HSA6_ASCIM|nr:hypothetical protein BJ508DRAFT_417507 [Ascobolus immersus RN42]
MSAHEHNTHNTQKLKIRPLISQPQIPSAMSFSAIAQIKHYLSPYTTEFHTNLEGCIRVSDIRTAKVQKPEPRDRDADILETNMPFMFLLQSWQDLTEALNNPDFVDPPEGLPADTETQDEARQGRQVTMSVAMLKSLDYFAERLEKGMVRDTQADLVLMTLELWKRRFERWMGLLGEDDGEEWDWSDWVTYGWELGEDSTGMLMFFVELRSESVEVRITRYLDTEP